MLYNPILDFGRAVTYNSVELGKNIVQGFVILDPVLQLNDAVSNIIGTCVNGFIQRLVGFQPFTKLNNVVTDACRVIQNTKMYISENNIKDFECSACQCRHSIRYNAND